MMVQFGGSRVVVTSRSNTGRQSQLLLKSGWPTRNIQTTSLPTSSLYIYAYRRARRNAGRLRGATLFASRCIFLQARTRGRETTQRRAANSRSDDATRNSRRAPRYFSHRVPRREPREPFPNIRLRDFVTRDNRHFLFVTHEDPSANRHLFASTNSFLFSPVVQSTNSCNKYLSIS